MYGVGYQSVFPWLGTYLGPLSNGDDPSGWDYIHDRYRRLGVVGIYVVLSVSE